jgi:hypothetical protein
LEPKAVSGKAGRRQRNIRKQRERIGSQLKGGGGVGATTSVQQGQSSVVQKSSTSTPAAADKIFCLKCGEKGHSVKECKAKVLCEICDKETHITERCTWLKQ